MYIIVHYNILESRVFIPLTPRDIYRPRIGFPAPYNVILLLGHFPPTKNVFQITYVIMIDTTIKRNGFRVPNRWKICEF